MQQAITRCNLNARNIRQQSTKTDSHKQKGFEFPDDAEVQQQQTDTEHRSLTAGDLIQTGALPDLRDEIHALADADQGVANRNDVAFGHIDCGNGAGRRRDHDRFHFHCLNDE